MWSSEVLLEGARRSTILMAEIVGVARSEGINCFSSYHTPHFYQAMALHLR
jgi:hypothetical protein